MAVDAPHLGRDFMNVFLCIGIILILKLYTFGGKYTHSGVNKSEMCSLEA